MNCENFRDVILDLARGQLLEAGARDGALGHAANCDRCRLRLEDERRLSTHLRTLAQAMKPFEAGQQIERQILTAYRSQRSVGSLPLKARRRKYRVATAAAVALLLVGLLIMQRIHRVSPRENPGATPTEKMETALRTSENDRKSLPHSSTKGRPVKNSVANKPRAVASYSMASRRPNRDREKPSLSDTGNINNEIATDFFPVGDTSATSLADGGQLVRVKLPRSALMRFGLPVNMDRANERVKADVLLGSDGIARAIRFVR